MKSRPDCDLGEPGSLAPWPAPFIVKYSERCGLEIIIRLIPWTVGEPGPLSPGESTLLYGLSYNPPYNPPHDKRILDDEEERRTRPSQPGGSRE